MLAAERRDYLLGVLTEEGKIVAKDIAERLGLSDDSVRRDLRELAAEGLCQRVYGGALPASPAIAHHLVVQLGRRLTCQRCWLRAVGQRLCPDRSEVLATIDGQGCALNV